MNYVNNISIYGFLSKNYFIDSDNIGLSFWKKKDKSQLCICRNKDIIDNYNKVKLNKINYMYLDEPLNVKGEFKMEQITSIIDNTYNIDNLCRQNHKEIYETYRKYKDKIIVNTDISYIESRYDDIFDMIETWRYADYGGMKYMWQERAGVDKSFIKRYLENTWLQDNSLIYLFTYKDTEDIIGYSVMPKVYEIENDIPMFSYMLRKCILKSDKYNLRNITEYIDWYTFNDTLRTYNFDKILINWGCSEKGVKWYKIHKWDLYKLENKWFYNYKKK